MIQTKSHKVLNHTKKFEWQEMSVEISNDKFRADMIKQIKEIQETLNELKIIKTSGGKKSTERKTAKRKTVKRKTAKRKTSKRR